jgi:peptide/nickel transport system ATP-binding protein
MFEEQPQKILEINGLGISFRQGKNIIPAVNGISFSLFANETLALVGESGSGKSVTALSIMRLIPVPPAEIKAVSMKFRGRDQDWTDLQKSGEKQLQEIRGKNISMVFQEPMTSLNPVFTCGDQVSEGLITHLDCTKNQAKKKTLELFREVMLPDPERIFKAYPHELSGGQKQRVMIAMAISCDPSILIADEPTTALDVTVQKTILQLLKQIQKKRGMSILFITHDLGLVSGFADRVMVMYKGQIAEEGTVDKVFKKPVHPYTRGLLACRPPLHARLKRLPTVADFIEGQENISRKIVSGEERQKDHNHLYSMDPVLRAVDLMKTFSGTKAVDKVSFQIFPGETLGIVGESGSGKTSLARVVLELIPPDAGKIFFRNTDITLLSRAKMKDLRKHLQIIFQDPYSSLNPRMTAGNAILEPMKVHRLHADDKARREKVVELLEKVGLGRDHIHRYPHEFSGGQRQRVCIARALAVEPQLIICDESVSALDVSVQAQVLNLLNDLKKDLGLTYIFISHDLSVVRYMSDRIIIMRNGRIIETGDADLIFTHPENEYTRALIEAIPVPEFLH